MADVACGSEPQNPGMRLLSAMALAVSLTACAPAAVASPSPAAELTSAPPSAAPASEEPSPTQLVRPADPAKFPVPPQVPMPQVGLVQQAFAFGALPAAGTAGAEELQLTQQSLEPWTVSFAEMLTRYQSLYAADAQKQLELKSGFESMVNPGPFAEVLKIWALREPIDGRTFTVSGATIQRLYAKPWGRAAYADVGLRLIETGGPNDSTRDLRIRVTVGRQWRLVDAWDATTGRWLAGDGPQYSALVLESEAPGAVANYLWNESFVAGGSEQYAQRPGLSTFLQARIDALKELNTAFKEHRMVERRFEGATVKILGFDPATYLGDGVLTVSVSGRLVQTDGSGNSRVTPFTQQMKFLRTVRGMFASLNAIDQQSTNGTWDSGGELALHAVDIEFG